MVASSLVGAAEGTPVCPKTVPQCRLTSVRDGVGSNASESKVVTAGSVFVVGEKEVDAPIWPVHVSITVFETLFSFYPIFQSAEKTIEPGEIFFPTHLARISGVAHKVFLRENGFRGNGRVGPP